MRKFLLSTTVIISLLVFFSLNTAFALRDIKIVPLDHWSYSTLDYLIQEGFLPPVYAAQFDSNKEIYDIEMEKYAEVTKQVFDLGKPESVDQQDWQIAWEFAKAFVEEYRLLLRSDPNQAVPLDHWSYTLMEILGRQESIAGFPDDFNSKEGESTRGDFAQAIARFLDAMGNDFEEKDMEIIMLLEALMDEYEDILKTISCV